MSGTSMDGLDICVADINLFETELEFVIVHFNSIPYGDKNSIKPNKFTPITFMYFE